MFAAREVVAIFPKLTGLSTGTTDVQLGVVIPFVLMFITANLKNDLKEVSLPVWSCIGVDCYFVPFLFSKKKIRLAEPLCARGLGNIFRTKCNRWRMKYSKACKNVGGPRILPVFLSSSLP